MGPQPRSARSSRYFTSTSVVSGIAVMFCDRAQVSRRSQCRTHCWIVLNPPLSYTIARSAFISSCESGDPGFGPPAIAACSPQRSTIALSRMPHFLASPSSLAFSDAFGSSARGSIVRGLFASGRGSGGPSELFFDPRGDRPTANGTSARPNPR